MDENSTERPAEAALLAGEAWFDPIEAGLRERIRGFIEELLEQELTAALGRRRHGRGPSPGHRHGHRERRLPGSFGAVAIAVPRARLRAENGSIREWRSAALPRYARRTRQVEALIAGAYLSGTGHRQLDLPGVGDDALAAVAVAGVAGAAVAGEVVIHLRVQRPLGERLLQAVEEAVRVEGRLRIGTRQQLVEDRVRNTGLFASRHVGAPSLPSCPPVHGIPGRSSMDGK